MRFLSRLKKCIPLFDAPLANSVTQYNPFFIIGSGRSGNTLLRRILQSHPDIHIPPETYVLGDVINGFKNNANLYWNDLVGLMLAKFQFHPEFETFGIDLRPLLDELIDSPKEKRSLCHILDRFYRYHAKNVADKETARWGDKTPLNTFYLHDIAEVFPRAQFIHIVRDGCDVVSSYMKAGIYKDLESAASRWRDSIDIINRFKATNSSAVLEIHYEELVSNTREVVRSVCEFLNVEFSESMLASEKQAASMGDVGFHKHHSNISKSINKNSIGKGRKQLTDDQLHKLQILIGKHLEQLEYPPCIE
jgi:hypothetical protein